MIKTRIESNQHSIIPRLLKEPIHFIRGLWKTTVDNRYDISHGGVTDLATSHQIRVINFPIRLVDYRGRSVPGFVFKTQMRQPDSKMRESAGSLVIEGFNNDIWAPGGRAGDYKHTAFRHAYASITDIQQAQKHDRQAQYILKALELMGFTNATFLSNLAEQGLVLHIQLETNFPIMSGMGGSVALAALAMYGLAAYKGIDWQEQLTPQDIAAMGILVESSLGGLGGVQDALFMKWMREIVGNGLEDFRNDIAAWLPPDRQRLFLEAFDRHVVLFNFGPHKASNTLQIIIENELRRDPDFLKKREAAAAHFEAVKKSLKGISEKGVGGFGGLLEEKSRTFDQLAPGHLTPEARALKQELLDQGHDVNIAFMGAGAGGFLAIWINYRDDEEDAQRRERDDVIQFLKTKVDPQRDPHGVYPFVSNPDQVGGLTEQFTRKRFGGFPSVMRFFHRILDRGSSSQSDDILLSVRRAFFGLSLAWVFLGWFSGISPFAVIGGLFLLSIFATFFSAWLLSKFVNQSQGLPNEEMMASTIGENDTTSPDKIHVSETAMGVSPRSDEDLSGNGPSFDDESAPAFENALSLTATALASPNRRSPDDHFDLRQVLDHSTANTVILLNGETVKARFSPEQVAELFAWVDWYPGRIKLMFYNADAADSFWMPFHQLPRGTIEMTAGSAEEAYGTAQRVFTQTGRPALHEFIHLSKGDLAAADQVSPEAQQEMLFFRYAPNDSVHGMVAALLRLVHYAEADRLQEGLREMGLGRDAQGFLTFVDQALRQLYLLENARLVVSMSA
jgi:galactokinase/mevalonate kinase-like predicted kinase